MLQFFKDFLNTFIGSASFTYFNKDSLIDVLSVFAVCIGFYLVIKLIINLIRYFVGFWR